MKLTLLQACTATDLESCRTTCVPAGTYNAGIEIRGRGSHETKWVVFKDHLGIRHKDVIDKPKELVLTD